MSTDENVHNDPPTPGTVPPDETLVPPMKEGGDERVSV